MQDIKRASDVLNSVSGIMHSAVTVAHVLRMHDLQVPANMIILIPPSFFPRNMAKNGREVDPLFFTSRPFSTMFLGEKEGGGG